jgi:hypothetical protein
VLLFILIIGLTFHNQTMNFAKAYFMSVNTLKVKKVLMPRHGPYQHQRYH